MTDDEMSEFAEMLADACRCSELPVSSRGARRIRAPSCCPMAAAMGLSGRVGFVIAAAYFRVDEEVTSAFAEGFDGDPMWHDSDPRAYALGCAFRELYP